MNSFATCDNSITTTTITNDSSWLLNVNKNFSLQAEHLTIGWFSYSFLLNCNPEITA